MKRPPTLYVALAATVLATLWLASSDDDADDPGLPARRVAEMPPAGADAPAPKPRGREQVPARAALAAASAAAWPDPPRERGADPWPFDPAIAQAWAVPPPPPPPPPPPAPRRVAPEPPAPPQAPAFPYTWLGRVEDASGVQALLAGPQQTLSVKARDVIDGQWRVDVVDGQSLTLTWLPGGQPQTLRLRPS